MARIWDSMITREELDKLRATVETVGWDVLQKLINDAIHSVMEACMHDNPEDHKIYKGKHMMLHIMKDLKEAVREALTQIGENEKEGVDTT